MSSPLEYFATAPKGLSDLLADELRALGAQAIAPKTAGVAFSGDLETAYRVCLWSRLANRVLLPLATFDAPDTDALYEGVSALNWLDHLGPDSTLAVDFTTTGSRIRHTRYGAQRVKDAIVDQLRTASGTRPSVDTRKPDVRIHAHVQRDVATVSIDLSGDSLHRRGYRPEGGAAPLKENLAAALLVRAGWPEIAASDGALVDPLCGSGTLTIEAALMAADIAPALARVRFGFSCWRPHQAEVWSRLLGEAQTRREAGLARLPRIYGYDADARAVRGARDNVARAGLAGRIRIEQRELAALRRPPEAVSGLVITNPPYGERLGDRAVLGELYAKLGAVLREEFEGWRAAVFTGNPDLGKRMGLRAQRLHTLYNGALECRLLHFEIAPQWFVGRPLVPRTGVATVPAGSEMFANRLRKNLKQLTRWARREGVRCYRLYDADMPEFNLAVDLYQGEGRWVHVQEYEAPSTVDAAAAQQRLAQAVAAVPAVLSLAPADIFIKQRRRQRGGGQYQKLADEARFHVVEEGGLRFLVNFTDYLDTGLFLDHRPTRALIRSLAGTRRFLNLFAYTGTATVCAAAGGARITTSVDLSQTYLTWAQRNLALNGFAEHNHELIRADCLRWLAEQSRTPAQYYDLIFLDPPTFSASKRMAQSFDVQRDHVRLIRQAVSLLAPDGVLIFANNLRRFRLERDAFADLAVTDLSAATVPPDFGRNRRIHHCWKIERR